ncbi:hypothetical protein [Pseudomonas sp. zfem002]|uniref:hypothetical protein n=1 Tax=Pseudomonas sp. zfem002 TaxID=3078197 RepID=UPI002929E216|nr:hypothetical protein [Pseudomonas sp. zfem002]MDU9393795.1 hypothetical protein [Pseudomonas sp. zfem002]
MKHNIWPMARRRLLEARYDWHWHSSALVERIEQTLTQLADQRLYNFTGAMLRHHQHKNTRDMAQ